MYIYIYIYTYIYIFWSANRTSQLEARVMPNPADGPTANRQGMCNCLRNKSVTQFHGRSEATNTQRNSMIPGMDQAAISRPRLRHFEQQVNGNCVPSFVQVQCIPQNMRTAFLYLCIHVIHRNYLICYIISHIWFREFIWSHSSELSHWHGGNRMNALGPFN